MKDALWIALVVSASVLFSLALACATPFAAIAAMAGMKMPRGQAIALVTVAWFANQTIGYLVLGYPRTWESFTWGAAIGIAAVLATFTAIEIRHRYNDTMAALAVAFVVAFAIYEAALFAATAVLPSGDGAFSLAIIGRIFAINCLGLAALLSLHRGALLVGLVGSPQPELHRVRA